MPRRQTIPDDDDAFVLPLEMVQRLLVDNRHIAEQQRAAIAVYDDQRDCPHLPLGLTGVVGNVEFFVFRRIDWL